MSKKDSKKDDSSVSPACKPGVLSLCRKASPDLIEQHLARMDQEYLGRYSDQEVAAHLDALAGLGTERRCLLKERRLERNLWELTVVAYDYPSLFSLVAGSLASAGISIEQGEVWTWAEAEPQDDAKAAGKIRRELMRRRSFSSRRGSKRVGETAADLMRKKKIVDVFTLRCPDKTPPDWRRFEDYLNWLIDMLEQDRLAEARDEVSRNVVGYLSRHQDDLPRKLLPVEVNVDNNLSGRYTLMDITAEDTAAFLYLFTNALAMRAVDIHSLTINTLRGRVEDRFFITDRRGRKISGKRRIDELKFIVTLVKQFSHLLVRSPDPTMALSNFERLVERIYEDRQGTGRTGWQLLEIEDESVMDALARLFGTSHFLWEDFLRLQYENLLPVFSDLKSLDHHKDRATMWAECEVALINTRTYEEACQALNSFKDREMFRIDMRHILEKIENFSEFTRELTDLAEVVIEAAYRICDSDLRKTHGEAMLEGGGPCRFSIFALGKAGGQELGYASDIELLFIYSGAGSTDGDEPVTNYEYYVKLVQKIIRTIRVRHRGIFELDLRFRPNGKQGPLANTLAQIEEYYSDEGKAWDFERQCLVRLRFIAGDEELGRRVSAVRDRFVYSPKPLEMKELWRLRSRQLKEIVKPGTWSAKFSSGGLVDLEYHVQHLQIALGFSDPELRSTSMRKALKALRRGGYICEDDFRSMAGAHDFLRRLINALRILRGNAYDLVLPDVRNREFLFLARRMGYPPGEESRLAGELEHQRSVVTGLVDWQFKVEMAARLKQGALRRWTDKVLDEKKLVYSTTSFLKFGLEEALGRIAAGRFRNVELWGNVKHLDPRNEEEDVHRVAAVCKRLGLEIASIHAPFTVPAGRTIAGRMKAWEELVRRSLEHARLLGCLQVVVHPFSAGQDEPETPYHEVALRTMDSLTRLADHAARFGLRLAVENMPGHRTRRFGRDVGELYDFVCSSGRSNLGLCLDTGHVVFNNGDVTSEFTAYADRIFAIHLNDNIWGMHMDLHLVPGAGSVDWKLFRSTLEKVPFDGMIVLELDGRG
ncbi:MAG: TIM barrel protein, partial [Gemmatimonadota bacterium]|nr:TIM barrel protein [Gemmatimonadota bacterium]